MKAAYRAGMKEGRTKIAFRDIPQPVPGENQVLVRVHASALNRGELIVKQQGAAAQPAAPKPLGNEIAGEVVELGPGVPQTMLGKRVMSRASGGFAEFALADAREAMPMPDTLSWTDAAAIPIVFMVAYDVLVAQGSASAGERVLVAGVSSGVGVAALQLAKTLGLTVIGTSRSRKKLDILGQHGLDAGLDESAADFPQALAGAVGDKGVDLAVDIVGGSMFTHCMRSLGYEGRLAIVGYVDGVLKSEIDIEALHAKRLRLFGVSNKLRPVAQRAALTSRFIADVIPLFSSGKIKPFIDSTYPMADIAAALARMESDTHVGKIVITMRDS